MQIVQQLQGVLQSKPKIDTYATENEWAQAYEQWSQAVHHLQGNLYGYQQHREHTRQQQQEQERARKQWEGQREKMVQDKVAEAITSREDWYDTINNPSVPSLRGASPAAWEAVIDSDRFADLTYYLARNPAEIRELSSMTPVGAVRHIAKLEAKLEQRQPAKPAQAPPAQIHGRGAPVNPDKLSIDEWMAWRNSQLRE